MRPVKLHRLPFHPYSKFLYLLLEHPQKIMTLMYKNSSSTVGLCSFTAVEIPIELSEFLSTIIRPQNVVLHQVNF